MRHVLFFYFSLVALLLALQPQEVYGGFIETLRSKILGSVTPETKQQGDVQLEEPSLPPAEQFCSSHNCLPEGVPTKISPTSSVQLNKESTDRPHPQVVKFVGQRSESVAAKFRSLSKRNMAIYWDDGKDGVYQGLLKSGHTTQSNSYHGHRFFFTDEKNKNDVIGTVTIDRDKILNPIRDKSKPLDDGHPVMSQTLKEEAYDREYMAKNDGLRCVDVFRLFCFPISLHLHICTVLDGAIFLVPMALVLHPFLTCGRLIKLALFTKSIHQTVFGDVMESVWIAKKRLQSMQRLKLSRRVLKFS